MNDYKFKEFKLDYVKKAKIIIQNSRNYALNNIQNNSDIQKVLTFTSSWEKYIDGKNYEQRLNAVKILNQNNMIEINTKDMNKTVRKVYISDDITKLFTDKKKSGLINYKSLMLGNDKVAATLEMHSIIINENLEVPLKKSPNTLGQILGETNQIGVVALLYPSQFNIQKYQNNLKNYKNAGGDVDKLIQLNKKTVSIIKQMINNCQIVKAEQIGSFGVNQLDKMRIYRKADPTDYIVYYKDNDEINRLKISAKFYKTTSTITLKSSGITNAGQYYLGEKGKDLDALVIQKKKQLEWYNKDISEIERIKKVSTFRKWYTNEIFERLSELSNSVQGQQIIYEMWRQVHGCNTDVYIQITNSKTNQVTIKSSKEYLIPQMKFQIKKTSSKVLICPKQIDNQNHNLGDLSLRIFSPATGVTLLRFDHISKKSNKEGNNV